MGKRKSWYGAAPWSEISKHTSEPTPAWLQYPSAAPTWHPQYLLAWHLPNIQLCCLHDSSFSASQCHKKTCPALNSPEPCFLKGRTVARILARWPIHVIIAMTLDATSYPLCAAGFTGPVSTGQNLCVVLYAKRILLVFNWRRPFLKVRFP